MSNSSARGFPCIQLFLWVQVLFCLTSGICCYRTVLAQHAIPPEAWIEMRKMYRDKSPPTTVEEDIEALAGRDARRAGPRLLDRGPEVLPAVHATLLQPDLEPGKAIGLLQVIQALADSSSILPLLKILQDFPSTPLRRDILLTLAYLPSAEESRIYVTNIAADDREPWKTRRMAYTWFGIHRDPAGRAFAETLLQDPDPEKRSAALFVLARLGDAAAIDPITDILATGAPANSRDALMISLAELVSPQEFITRAPASLAWSEGYKNALLYTRYLHADTNQKPSICLDLLHSNLPGHLGIAVRCLLETGHADDLRPFAALSLEVPGRDALIRNEIRKAGWHVLDTEEKFMIVP